MDSGATDDLEGSQIFDVIEKPAHYNHGSIEVADAIEDWKLPYFLGNVVKYVARCDYKGKPVEDLKKAVWYLNREIARRERDS